MRRPGLLLLLLLLLQRWDQDEHIKLFSCAKVKPYFECD